MTIIVYSTVETTQGLQIITYSNVDITNELVSLIRAQQSFNGAARLMQAEIEIVNKFSS